MRSEGSLSGHDGTVDRTGSGGSFEFPAKITEAINRDLPPIRYTTGITERQTNDGMVFKYTRIDIDALPPRIDGLRYHMHGDPGLVKDAFTVCVCHKLPETGRIVDGDGTERDVNRVAVDFVLTWQPTSRTPVDFLNVESTMLNIARYYDIRFVTFDRWNSAPQIRRLIEAGISAEDMAFSSSQQLEMYRNLKLLIYQNLCDLPEDDELQDELKFLKLVNGKVDHDVRGKDRADSVAAAVWNATGKKLSAVEDLVAQTVGTAYRDAGPGYQIIRKKVGT